jgi:small subunit ribosomal protein S20
MLKFLASCAEYERKIMANTAQAKKRARQAIQLNKANSMLRSRFRTAIKALLKTIQTGDKVAAQTLFSKTQKEIDIVADKKIIHKNKAARHKSRLAAAIKAMA